ncbi:MAG TPA: ABC transporter permease subunit [Ramlibacter sp.]|uniref:ABC transporter permease n=1 Tax=Ramlibacter sp. TaxID=1917967 RepID=UPI002C315E55|nr:ABC transporter permease subunit [Ramlibacter sp.]HVZ45166.1 ABC transporter permease subunit [Ramlibacter sp.]
MTKSGISRVGMAALAAGYVFLYAPILCMVVYSFNDNRLATVWGSFSFAAYGQLFADEQLRGAALLSLRIALLSGAAATVLGTVAGFCLARFRRLPTITLFAALVTSPMVMPEVIVAFSLLLLFLFVLRIDLGFGAIWAGHATLGMAYVATLVRSRLLEMDLSLEEAALNLGARPVKVFFTITLPIVAPTLVAGYLLSFTLSWDDVVLTSLLAGAGVNTLPTLVFSSVKFGISPKIYALATLIVCAVTAGVIASNRFMLRHARP